MSTPAKAPEVETDPRFPSGPWTGFYLYPHSRARHMMEIRITFREGRLTGEGRDEVGRFVLSGRYDVADGKCRWTKRYVGKHDVYYQGFNEGKGIWGTWEIPTAAYTFRGGFHIWPEGMEDPTRQHLTEEADLPILVEEVEEVAETQEAPARG